MTGKKTKTSKKTKSGSVRKSSVSKGNKFKRARQKAKYTRTLGERLLECLTQRYRDELALKILKAGLYIYRRLTK